MAKIRRTEKNLKKNRDYWINKIEGNIARDQINDDLLDELSLTPMLF